MEAYKSTSNVDWFHMTIDLSYNDVFQLGPNVLFTGTQVCVERVRSKRLLLQTIYEGYSKGFSFQLVLI